MPFWLSADVVLCKKMNSQTLKRFPDDCKDELLSLFLPEQFEKEISSRAMSPVKDDPLDASKNYLESKVECGSEKNKTVMRISHKNQIYLINIDL